MNVRHTLLAATLAATSSATQADTIRLQWNDLQPEVQSHPWPMISGPIDLDMTFTGTDMYRTGLVHPSLLTGLTIGITTIGSDPGWAGRRYEYQVMPLFYNEDYGGGLPVDWLCCSASFYFDIGGRYFEYAAIRAAIGNREEGQSVSYVSNLQSEGPHFEWHTYFINSRYAVNGAPIVTAVPEPGTLGLMLAGLCAVCRFGRRASSRMHAAPADAAAVA